MSLTNIRIIMLAAAAATAVFSSAETVLASSESTDESSVEVSDSSVDTIDSSTEAKDNIIRKIIRYFDQTNKKQLTTRPSFSLIGGPGFTSEKGLMLGFCIAGDYSTDPADHSLPASNISIKGALATKSYYSVGLEGVHVFPDNSKRINYELDFMSFGTYFWGVGYEWANNNDNKTKYNLFEVTLNGDFAWRTAPGLYIGPAADITYTNAYDMDSRIPWMGSPTHYYSLSAGLKLQYDLRDNLTYPHRGMLLELTQLCAPRFIGNGNHSFSSTELNLNLYTPLWRGGVLASHLRSRWSYGSTPWNKMSFLGGDAMRGYYEGRYRDKNAADLVFELRQHIHRRIGIALWGGAGTVYHDFRQIQLRRMLPEGGFGFRWEFKKNSNIRLDAGIGKHSTGFMFGMNEAF